MIPPAWHEHQAARFCYSGGLSCTLIRFLKGTPLQQHLETHLGSTGAALV